MKTIVEVALATKFTESQIPAIMEVIGATPNPDMATEILLGIWEEPVVPKFKIRGYKNKSSDTDTVCTLTHVSLWEGVVSYTYEKPETKGFYIPRGTDKSLVTIDNIDEFKSNYDSENGSDHIYLLTGNMINVGDTVSLAEWMNWSNVGEGA